jgi:AraC family transcriptional regulator
MAPLPEHLLRVHAGPPTRAACHVRRFRYTRGDIDIVPAGTAGAWTNDEPATSLVIGISPALVRRAAEEMGLDADGASVEARHQVRDARIEHVAWALEAEHRAAYPNGRLYADSLGLGLAFHMLGSYARHANIRYGLSKEQLLRLTDYIEDHIDRDLSITRLARVIAISASHLKVMFKRSTGLSVHEHVIRRRVERAKLLLLRGELPSSQIALEAGFAHQSHMARWMRRILGVTPSAITRSLQ